MISLEGFSEMLKEKTLPIEWFGLYLQSNIANIPFEYKTNNYAKLYNEFKDDVKEGYGIDYYSNGERYEGEFKNNRKEGFGIYYYPTGGKYSAGIGSSFINLFRITLRSSTFCLLFLILL